MRNNVYAVLENLNSHAKSFVEQHRHENRGYHFVGVFGRLQSALDFSMQSENGTSVRIRSLLGALDSSFNYALFVLGLNPLFFDYPNNRIAKENIRMLFRGYKAGHKPYGKRYTLGAGDIFSEKEFIVLLAQEDSNRG